jgi:hypothetical protein
MAMGAAALRVCEWGVWVWELCGVAELEDGPSARTLTICTA